MNFSQYHSAAHANLTHMAYSNRTHVPSYKTIKGKKIFPSELKSGGNIIFLAKVDYFPAFYFK